LTGFHQGLEEASNTILGHRKGFTVGVALRDASWEHGDRHYITTLLGGLEVCGVGIGFHAVALGIEDSLDRREAGNYLPPLVVRDGTGPEAGGSGDLHLAPATDEPQDRQSGRPILAELEKRYDSQFRQVFSAIRALVEAGVEAPSRIGF
jgi:hypothetical protein